MRKNKNLKKLMIYTITSLMILSSITMVANAAHIEIGTNTTTEPYVPVYCYYDYGWSEELFLQSEIGAAIDIIGLSYYVASYSGTFPYTVNNCMCYIAHSTQTSLTTTKPDSSLMTLVYSGGFTIYQLGWNTIWFNVNTFSYDNIDNLLIYWENWDGDYDYPYPYFQYTYAYPYRAVYDYQDGSMPDTGSTTSYLANIRLHFQADHDVAVTDIVTPDNSEAYGSVPVRVQVKNNGLNTETFPVNVKIDQLPELFISEGFEDCYSTRPAPPTGWAIEDSNGDGYTSGVYAYNEWGGYSSTTYAHTGTMSMRCEDGSSVGNDDWLFTNGVELTAGVSYELSFWTRMSSSSTSYDNQMDVWYGSSQDSGGMSTMIWTDTNMHHTTHTQDTATFTVPLDGMYYLGFWRHNGYSYADLYLDDVVLQKPVSGTVYDQTVTMTNLGVGAVSEANLPDWNIYTAGRYQVTATTLLGTDGNTADDVLIKETIVGFVDGGLDEISIPKPLMGPAPFQPVVTVNNSGDLDFNVATVGQLPVHAWVPDPTGGSGLCYEEDFEGAPSFNYYEGDVEINMEPNDITKEGDYVRFPGQIIWAEDEPDFGDPGDWTVLNPDNNGAMWHASTYRSSSPTQSMYCGDEVTHTYLPNSGVSGAYIPGDILISPRIYVGTNGGSFDMDIYNDVEGFNPKAYPDYGDFIMFGASPDGMTWNWWFGTNWWMYWATYTGITIFPSDADADGYTYLAFAFCSDSYWEYEGIYLDNIKVYASPNLYDETVFIDLDAGDTTDVTFPTFSAIPGYDTYTLNVCCEYWQHQIYQNPDDNNPANDCLSVTFNNNAPVYIEETGLGYATIQEGIDAAEPGQTVHAQCGTYYENLIINKSVTVTGELDGSTQDGSTCTWDHDHCTYLVGTVDIVGEGGGGTGPGPSGLYDFENDDGGFIPDTTVGDWEWTNTYDVSNYVYGEYPTSEHPPTTAYSGTGMWGTVMYAPYSNSGSDTTLSQTFDLTGISDAQLSFWSYENVFGDWDYCEIYVNGNLEWGPDWDSTSAYWKQVIVDLSDYSGMSGVDIVFSMHATTVVAYAGWYIDDVMIGSAAMNSERDGSMAVLQKFDITPGVTFTEQEAAVFINRSNVLVQQNTIHNVEGAVDDNISAIEIFGNVSGKPLANVNIENNTIYTVLNTGGSMSFARDTIFFDDFDSYPLDWTIDGTATCGYWDQLNFGTACGSTYHYIMIDDYKYHSAPYAPELYYNCPNDDWLTSPVISLAGYQNAELDFWYFWDDSWDIEFEVLIEDQANPNVWSSIKTYILPGTSPETWYNDVISISGYDGKDIRIAWRYTSNNEWAAYFDDILVTGEQGGPGPGPGGAECAAIGVFEHGFIEGAIVIDNRVEEIHSAGHSYGVDYAPENVAPATFQPATDWIQYCDDYTENGLGLTAGGTCCEAIQLTDTELANYRGMDICEIIVSIGCDAYGADSGIPYDVWISETQPTDPTTATVYATGTSDSSIWNTIDVDDYTIPASGDVWLGVIYTHPSGVYPMGFDTTNTNSRGGYLWDAPDGWLTLSGIGYPGVWGIKVGVCTGGGGGGSGPVDITVNCNYFRGIGDNSTYDVWADPLLAPYPGVMFKVEEPNVPGAGNASAVTLKCNYFDNECIDWIYAVENNDTENILDATLNYWGQVDGPDSDPILGDVQDPATGQIADGRGANIVLNGPVMFDPWLGVHAEIVEPMGMMASVEVGQPLTFDASCPDGSFGYCFPTCDECCEPEYQELQYLWDFDDGYYSSNKVAIHVFDQPGIYHVSLMVDTFGFPYHNNFMYDWAYIDVEVVPAGSPLDANADGEGLGEYETSIDSPVTLYGSATGGEAPYFYSWDFGDGTSTQTSSPAGNIATHKYAEPGTYTVTLTVIDMNGDRATDTSTVVVYGIEELVVSIGGNVKVSQGDSVTFTSSVSGGRSPYTYSWNFGDGIISNKAKPTHIYENSGIYTVTLTVTDNMGAEKTKTKTVTVSSTDTSEVEISNVKGGLLLKATIVSDMEVSWSIDVQGRVFFGGAADGTAQGVTQVKLPFTLAFGNVDIAITAGTEVKEYTAFAFGPLFFGLQEA